MSAVSKGTIFSTNVQPLIAHFLETPRSWLLVSRRVSSRFVDDNDNDFFLQVLNLSAYTMFAWHLLNVVPVRKRLP